MKVTLIWKSNPQSSQVHSAKIKGSFIQKLRNLVSEYWLTCANMYWLTCANLR